MLQNAPMYVRHGMGGALKTLVNETPVDTDTDLVTRIYLAAANIRKMPGILKRVQQSI